MIYILLLTVFYFVCLVSIGAGLIILGEWAAEQFDIDLEE